MARNALAAIGLLIVVSGCGGGVSDPASARCPSPASHAGARVVLKDHIELPVTFTCVGARIRGTLFLPRSHGPYPALAWVHAAGPVQRLGWHGITNRFVDAGYAIFSFDKRGVGQSGGECCPGDTGHFNLATADVVGAVAALRKISQIDAAHIGLFGASQAGWIAPRAAVESGHVAFVVLAAPGIVTFGQEHRYEQLTGGNGSDKPFPSESQITKALGDPSGFDVRPYLRRLDVPILWLLAGRDKEVPLRASLAILKRLARAGKDYSVKVYPGAGHGLFDVPPTSPKAMPDTLAWLRSHH
jgi:uncharacterized protein